MHTTLLLTGSGFSLPFLKYGKHKLDTQFLTDLVTQKELCRGLFAEVHPTSERPPAFDEIVDLCNELKSALAIERPGAPDNFEILFNLISEDVRLRDRTDDGLGVLLTHKRPEYSFTPFDLFRFKEFVLNVIAQFSASEDDVQLLARFASKLLQNSRLRHYTLNYDGLFEDALSRIERDSSTFLTCRDVNQGCRYLEEEGAIHDQYIFGHPVLSDYVPKHCLFHLHGATWYSPEAPQVWRRNRQRSPHSPEYWALKRQLYAEVERKSGLGIRNLRKEERSFITGVHKADQVMVYPYSSIYQSFIRDYQNCDEVIVMGYSFNDPHINAVLSFPNHNTKRIATVDHWPEDLTDDQTMARWIEFQDRLTSRANFFGTDTTQIGAFDWNTDPPVQRLKTSEGPRDEFADEDAVVRWEYDFNGTRSFIQRMLANQAI